MDPAKKERLEAYTAAAKAIIYHPQRAEKLIAMAGSPDGVMQAIRTVIAGLEQRKPIPPAIVPLLAVNIFMILIDMAKEITGQTPDVQFVTKMVQQILKGTARAYDPRRGQKPQQPQQPPQPQQQPGLLAQGVPA